MRTSSYPIEGANAVYPRERANAVYLRERANTEGGGGGSGDKDRLKIQLNLQEEIGILLNRKNTDTWFALDIPDLLKDDSRFSSLLKDDSRFSRDKEKLIASMTEEELKKEMSDIDKKEISGDISSTDRVQLIMNRIPKKSTLVESESTFVESEDTLGEQLVKNMLEKCTKTPPSIIFGLGPSASGKTFWAKKILKYLKKPSERYFTIDGGIFRENSCIYQLLRESFFQYNKGHASLVDVRFGPLFPSMFDSEDYKPALKDFFKKNVGLSFYIPTTNPYFIERKVYAVSKDYSQILIKEAKKFEITKENILCAFIFQCLDSCKYLSVNNNLACSGCQILGEEREMDEGKKYSSSGYSYSYEAHDFIYNSFKEHNLNCLKIHNSKDGYSIIEMSNDTPLIEDIIVLREETNNDKCIIVRNMKNNQALNEEYQSKVQSKLENESEVQSKLENQSEVQYKPEFFLFKIDSSLYGIYFNKTEKKNKLITFNSSVPKIITTKEDLELTMKMNMDLPSDVLKKNLVRIDEVIEPSWEVDTLRGKEGLYEILKHLLEPTGISDQKNLVEILNNFQKEPYEIPEGEYFFEESRPAPLLRTNHLGPK